MRQTKWKEAVTIIVAVLITAFAVTALLGTACNVPDEPTTANDWYRKGKAYADDEMYGKAIECLTKAIEIDPEIAKAYSYRGYCYYRMIQYEEAIVDFEIALKLDSNYSEINYYYIGRIFFNIEDYKTAINYFSNAIEINDKESDYYYYRGSSYDLLKIFDSAEEDFRKACALGESSGCEAVEGIVKKRIREKKREKNDIEETK